MTRLTTKQNRFAVIYNGNGVSAARDAGYKGSVNTLNQIAIKNLANPNIRKIILCFEKSVGMGVVAFLNGTGGGMCFFKSRACTLAAPAVSGPVRFGGCS